MKNYFLYNPLAGKGKAENKLLMWNSAENSETVDLDLTKMVDFDEFTATLNENDRIIICGGDGTLNRFVNQLNNTTINNEIIYYPAGSGNDFTNDLNRSADEGAFDVSDHIKTLPHVEIKGKDYRFINGVGFGVDGMVCAEGDRLRGNGKKVDYTLLAIKCLLFGFKPVNATVVVDGVEKHFEKVWMSTTMKGRFFGGGMMLTPDQKRNDPENKLSFVIVHDISKLRLLSLFPRIFKGTHTRFTDYVTIIPCNRVEVSYDQPCFLQVDGEPMSDVKGYSVVSLSRQVETV